MALANALAYPQNLPVLRLDVVKALDNPGQIKLSSMASGISYVPMEAKPGSFIQNINCHAICDKYILIADNKAGGVMKFDRKGRYLGDFMVKGKGPKEFSRIDGLDINSKGEILVLKNWSIIDIYSESGDLIKTFEYYGFATGRWLTDDKILLIMDYLVSRGKFIVTLDRQGKEISVGLSRSIFPGKSPRPVISKTGRIPGGYFYWCELFDTVFTIDYNGKVTPGKIIQKGDGFVKTNDYITDVVDVKRAGGKNSIRSYYEYRDKIYLLVGANRVSNIQEFDRKTGVGFTQSLTQSIVNDLDKGPGFLPKTVLPDGSIYQFLMPDELNWFLDYGFKQPRLIPPETYDSTLYRKLADYGNPVLMMVK